METFEIGKYTKSFGLSFAITSIISALLVIVKETNEDTVLKAMAAITGHHWVTHGLFDIVLFVALGWALSKLNNSQGLKITANALVTSIAIAIIVSGLLIVGFYA